MLTALLILPWHDAGAGGPLPNLVRPSGASFVWSTAAEIQYRTDNGPLSTTINEAAAQARVASMFQVWENVATASIGYNRTAVDCGNGPGFICDVGAFTDGDVSTLAEFDAVEGDCGAGNQSPIIYDPDGSLFAALGFDETSVIGFAGPCATNATNIISGEAAMNGLFQDGAAAPVVDLIATEYDGVFIHEFGHFSGLDHSQINVNCFISLCADGADDTFGLPTMFPFVLPDTSGTDALEESAGVASISTLSTDDIAWISRLYPSGTFVTTHGTITGVVFFTDTESHAQGVNVIARPLDAGGNEDRRNAVSAVSGYKFTTNQGNNILGLPGSGEGTLAPGDIGLFEIPVPAGSYTIEVETVDPNFEAGSSVGPLSPPIPMPGTAPAPSGTIVVAAGATSANNNMTLVGTDPRFDQFEGP